MFFEETRTDGLLRGPRSERSKQMAALGREAWDLETLLGLHLGLLDHAEDVRIAAMEALQRLAQKKPKPIAVSPVALLGYFMHSFTVASGMSLLTFECLVELNTAESTEIVEAVLESGCGNNIQFEGWVRIIQDANRWDILHKTDLTKLSKGRRKVIERALAGEPSSTT
jgi:hypothetical protein